MGMACVGMLLLSGVMARADVWTNTAGHAIEAELVSLNGKTAVFKLPDGREMTLPISGLQTAEQERARRQTNRVEVPERLRVEFDQCVRTLKRLRTLQDTGRLAPGEQDEQARIALARLTASGRELKLPEETMARILAAADSP
jgi:hypothetical protein